MVCNFFILFFTIIVGDTFSEISVEPCAALKYVFSCCTKLLLAGKDISENRDRMNRKAQTVVMLILS